MGGLSAYYELLVSHWTWDCIVNLAMNCFVWDNIIDVAREEEPRLLSFALSGGSGRVLGRWTVLKRAVILRTLRHLHQIEKVMRLVHLVVKQCSFRLDVSYITPIYFFVESTQSNAAFIFAKVQMLVRVCGQG